jgi:hypothetical protein
VNESPNDASGDSSRRETKHNSVNDDIIVADASTDEVVLFAGADVTTYSFAEIMNALKTVNNEPFAGMHRIVEVIKTLLPPSSDEHKFPLPNILLNKIPRFRRKHIWSTGLRNVHWRKKAGAQCSVNVFRSILLVEQLRLKFNQPESARAMRMSKTVCVSDITESIGFKETVFDSDFKIDSRNLVLLMGTDAVNPFVCEREHLFALADCVLCRQPVARRAVLSPECSSWWAGLWSRVRRRRKKEPVC